MPTCTRTRFTRTPDGMRHGDVNFVAIIYNGDGRW